MPFHGKFKAFYVERYCACGEQFKYTLATEEGVEKQQQLWWQVHRGRGHHPINDIEWQRIERDEKQKREQRAKKMMGSFPFMTEEKEL